MRRSKYGNRKVTVDGLLFDSKGEASRWLELCLLEKAKEISGLKRQVRYSLYSNDMHICDYVADFEYSQNGAIITEDFKGVVTDLFKLKAKLFEAQEGRKVKITKKR